MNWSRTMHIGDADADEIEMEPENMTTPAREARIAQERALAARAAGKPKSKVVPLILIGAAVVGVFYFMKRRSS